MNDIDPVSMQEQGQVNQSLKIDAAAMRDDSHGRATRFDQVVVRFRVAGQTVYEAPESTLIEASDQFVQLGLCPSPRELANDESDAQRASSTFAAKSRDHIDVQKRSPRRQTRTHSRLDVSPPSSRIHESITATMFGAEARQQVRAR